MFKYCEDIKFNNDNLLIMVDSSGSTTYNMNNDKTIYENELEYINQLVNERNISEYHLINWSDNAEYYYIENSKMLLNIKPQNGRTNLTSAFKCAVKNHIDIETTDIIIFTDGEINSGSYKKLAKYLNICKNIYIYTVEDNDYDYNYTELNAGNELYNILLEHKLTKKVKSFKCYNNNYIKIPFVNFINHDVLDGYIPFRNYQFKHSDFLQFYQDINILAEEIKHNETDILKLMYDCIPSINYYIKFKTDFDKNNIIKFFSHIFKDKIKINSTSFFDTNVEKYKNGQFTTFNNYIRNRTKLFESSQINIYKNGLSLFESKYITIPINDKIVKTNRYNDIIYIDGYKYNNCGYKANDKSIPLLPILNKMPESEQLKQFLRIYIRTLWKQKYNYSPESEEIFYLFLSDAFAIYLSTTDINIKNTFKYLALIMLDRRRFGSGGVKEIDFLQNGNEPQSLVGENKVPQILLECLSYFNKKTGMNIQKPFTLWIGIMNMMSEKLYKAQLKYCDDIKEFPQMDKIKIYEDNYETNNYLFIDPINFSEVEKGFVIESHNDCNNLFVFQNKPTYCPFCHSNDIISNKVTKKLEINSFNCDEYYLSISDTILYNKPEIISKFNYDDDTLIPFEDLSFNNYSYYINHKHINKIMNNSKLNITDQYHYNKAISKYGELFKLIDWDHMCICGGFNTGILYNKPINDIDVFLHSITSEDIVDYIKNTIYLINEQYKCLFYYKSENNVIEVFIENCCGERILKLQFIVKVYENKLDIFENFDIDFCKTLYDGDKLYFTNNSYNAIKYNYQKLVIKENLYRNIKYLNKYNTSIIFNDGDIDIENYTKFKDGNHILVESLDDLDSGINMKPLYKGIRIGNNDETIMDLNDMYHTLKETYVNQLRKLKKKNKKKYYTMHLHNTKEDPPISFYIDEILYNFDTSISFNM
jgi:hypothetical protein